MNAIVRVDFELDYHDVAVQHVDTAPRGTSSMMYLVKLPSLLFAVYGKKPIPIVGGVTSSEI